MRGIRVLGHRQCRAGMVLGFQGSQSSTRVFLSIDVFFSPGDRRLSGIQIRRSDFGYPGIAGRRDGLSSIAHFLHGSAAAASQAGDTDKYRNEAQHMHDGH